MNIYRKIDTTTGLFIEDALFVSQPVLMQTVTEQHIVLDTTGNAVTQTVTVEKPILDANGKAIPDPQYVDVPCSNGLYKPRWNGTQWVEGLTQIEIDAIKNIPHEPTEIDRIAALEDAMLFII